MLAAACWQVSAQRKGVLVTAGSVCMLVEHALRDFPTEGGPCLELEFG
jgi:hypothetical protein